MRSRLAVVLAVVAVLLLLVGAALWYDNPEVDVAAADLGSDGPAGRVECSIAPWDAGLNGNDDGPGGEHTRAYYEEMADECWAANRRRFGASVASGAAGLALLGASGAVAVRSRRGARVS